MTTTRLRGVPSRRALTAHLREIQNWLGSLPPETYLDSGDLWDHAGTDIRLQVVDESWAVHHGDPGYDLDHRGFWGAGWLPSTGGVSDIARDLIEQVRDEAAMPRTLLEIFSQDTD